MVNSGGGGLSPASAQPFPPPQGPCTHSALEKYSSDKGTGCRGTRAAQELRDYRARLGITQLTSATLVSPSPWHPEVTVMLG